MSIKNKITPEIKKKFLDEIKLTEKRNKERAFLLCLSKKGELYPSRTCEGTECTVNPFETMKPGTTGNCMENIQGFFHTHHGLRTIRDQYKEKRGRIISDEKIKESYKKREIELKEDTESGLSSWRRPSYGDLLEALKNKCTNMTKGTTCIGTTLDLEKVECWTAKIPSKKKDRICTKVYEETIKYKKEPPIEKRRWLAPLFDREIIDIKK